MNLVYKFINFAEHVEEEPVSENIEIPILKHSVFDESGPISEGIYEFVSH